MTRQKLKSMLIASSLAVAAAGGLALARGGTAEGNGNPARKAAMLQQFDANGDGALDAAERAKAKEAFAARRAQRQAARVAQFDADKDGALSPAERAAMRDQLAGERFARLDKDGDGKLSLDEFKAARGHRGGHRGGRGHHHRKQP